MKFALQFNILPILAIVFASCGKTDNTLPAEKKNAEMEQRINSLSDEVAETSANDRYQEQSARLTQKTVGETNVYLNKLYANINDTRPEDLPEWQDMYNALTTKSALEDPKFTLGARQEQTNFYRLFQASELNKADIAKLFSNSAANLQTDNDQKKALDNLLARMDTIDRNIADLNKTVEEKFKSVDKTLSDYNGRIEGVENRMKTVEISLGQFQSDFVAVTQRVNTITELLRKYDLATMHNDIKNLKKLGDNHEQRLIDLDGRVRNQQADIDVTRNNLTDTNAQLSSVAALAGSFRAAINDIISRMQALTATTNTHQQNIADINTNITNQQTTINNTQTLLATTRDELSDTDSELSGVSTEVGTLRAAVDDILVRIEELINPTPQ